MKHAGPAALARLQALLQPLRGGAQLVERSPGSFYLKSKAFVHFHEDGAEIFADIKLDGRTFTRLEVSSTAAQAELLERVQALLARSTGDCRAATTRAVPRAASASG